jgi:hypothetical protein
MLSPLTAIELKPEDSARAAAEKFLADLNTYNDKFEPYSEAWATQLDAHITYLTVIQKGLTNAQLYALALMKQHWDELPLTFRMGYNNDFWLYACLKTGRKMRRLEELIGAIETFVLGFVGPTGTVAVPKRNEVGAVIAGEVEYKEFDPLEVDSGKLVAVTSRAAKGQMTEQLWSMLVDDQVSVGEIEIELAGGRGKNAPDTSLKFYLDGPFLSVVENGVTLVLGEVEGWDEYYDDPNSLQRRAVKRMCAMLNIQMDDEVLRNQLLKVRRLNGHYIETKDEAKNESDK